MKKRDKPYVGQHAYYREQLDSDPMPCVVCYVGSDIVVNVVVFTPGCTIEPRISVNYWDKGKQQPKERIVSEE